jgi:hypothetical protein
MRHEHDQEQDHGGAGEAQRGELCGIDSTAQRYPRDPRVEDEESRRDDHKGEAEGGATGGHTPGV